MGRINDISNQTFNRLTVIRRIDKTKSNNIIWECCCVCSNTTRATTQQLTSGSIKSCGCLKKEREFSGYCSKCKQTKPETEFYKSKNPASKCGRASICKLCRKQTQDKWRKNNFMYNKDYSKEWRKKNPQYDSNREQEDLQHKLKRRLRSRLHDAVKWNYKVGSAVADLGCSIGEFKLYIENQFYDRKDETKMTWDNYGEWHLDHVQPLCSFNLEDRTEFLEACSWLNIRPLWAEENQARRREPYGMV
jgi:hypothetical protein